MGSRKIKIIQNIDDDNNHTTRNGTQSVQSIVQRQTELVSVDDLQWLKNEIASIKSVIPPKQPTHINFIGTIGGQFGFSTSKDILFYLS
jgi:hypothetical protein